MTGPKGADADQGEIDCPCCGGQHWAVEGVCGVSESKQTSKVKQEDHNGSRTW